MRRRVRITATVLLLAGCGGENGPSLSAPLDSVVDSAKRTAFLRAVEAIDPQLAEDGDRIVRAAQGTCGDLSSGKDRAAVVDMATERFGSAGDALTREEAELLVAAAERTFC